MLYLNYILSYNKDFMVATIFITDVGFVTGLNKDDVVAELSSFDVIRTFYTPIYLERV